MIRYYRSKNINKKIPLNILRRVRKFKLRYYLKKFIFKKINKGFFNKNKMIFYIYPYSRRAFYLRHTFVNFGKFTPIRNKIRGLWLLKKTIKLNNVFSPSITYNSFFNFNFSNSVFLLFLEIAFYSKSFVFNKILSYLIQKEFESYTNIITLKNKILHSPALISKLQNIYIESEKRFKFFPFLIHKYKKSAIFRKKKRKKKKLPKLVPIFAEKSSSQWVYFPKFHKLRSNGLLFYRKLGQCLNTTGRLSASYRTIGRGAFVVQKNLNLKFNLFDLFGYIYQKIKPDFSLVKYNIGRRASLIPKPTLGAKKQMSVAVKLFMRALNKRSERSFKERLAGELSDFILDKTPHSLLVKEELMVTAKPLRYAVKYFFKKKKKR